MKFLFNICVMYVLFYIRVESNFVGFEEFCGFCTEELGDNLTFVSSSDVILCG